MARNLSRSRRKEIKARKRQAYVLEHQRDLSEDGRKQYLLTLDPETNKTHLRNMEQTTPSFGLRSSLGAMLKRVWLYAGTPVPLHKINEYRFKFGFSDSYDEILDRWQKERQRLVAG